MATRLKAPVHQPVKTAPARIASAVRHEAGHRDLTPIGGVTKPPYFFSVSDRWHELEDAFATPEWIAHCVDDLRRSRARSIKSILRRLIHGTGVPNHLSPLLTAIRQEFIGKTSLRILDVGGGAGDNYDWIARGIGSGGLRWHVVDNQVSIDLGREVFSGRHGLTFSAEPVADTFDFVVVVGTLQYIRDWSGFLREITSRGRPRIFIARSPLRTNGPSFMTVQTVSPSSGPHALRKVGEANANVIGIEELEAVMSQMGYCLEIEGAATDYSANFARLPPQYRSIEYRSMLWCPATT